MENYFHIAVKLAAAGYILWKIWNAIFSRRLYGFWEWALGRARATEPVVAQTVAEIIGRTNIVLLDDPREPVASIELEPLEQATPVSPEDVETPYIPSEEELNISPPDENEMSSGVAFDDLSAAADVLTRGTTDDERRIKAAKTVYDIQNTEALDFLVREVSNAAAIGNLLNCLDADGFPKPKPATDFEMGRYV